MLEKGGNCMNSKFNGTAFLPEKMGHEKVIGLSESVVEKVNMQSQKPIVNGTFGIVKCDFEEEENALFQEVKTISEAEEQAQTQIDSDCNGCLEKGKMEKKKFRDCEDE
jgi:hypothetical protein